MTKFDFIGDYGCSTGKWETTITFNMAGGGSFWWNYKVYIDNNDIVTKVNVEQEPCEWSCGDLYIRTQDDGCQYLLAIERNSDCNLEEANSQVKAHYQEEGWEYDPDQHSFKPWFVVGDLYNEHGYFKN